MKLQEKINRELGKDLKWFVKNETRCSPLGHAIWEERIKNLRWFLRLLKKEATR